MIALHNCITGGGGWAAPGEGQNAGGEVWADGQGGQPAAQHAGIIQPGWGRGKSAWQMCDNYIQHLC